MLAAMSTTVFATEQSNYNDTYQIESVYTDQETLIYDYYNSLNKCGWTEWVSFYSPAVKNDYLNLVTEAKNLNDKIGILTVTSADVLSIEKLDDYYIPAEIYPELNEYFRTGNYECYRVAVDMQVMEENGYFDNGTNHKLIILVKDNETWSVGATCGDDESGIATFSSSHPTGKLVNCSNNSSSTMPSSIRVYVASSGKIETPTLANYVKNTIQNEVGNLRYPSDALKALCVASASHVQYYKLSKYYDAKGYDIQTTGGLVNYKPGTTVNSSITTAYSSVSGKYITCCEGHNFSTPYNALSAANSESSGQLYEPGAKQLANNGKDWEEILHSIKGGNEQI